MMLINGPCRVDYLWNIVMILSAFWTLILTAPIHDPLVSKWCNAKLLQTVTSLFIFGWIIILYVTFLGKKIRKQDLIFDVILLINIEHFNTGKEDKNTK